MPTTPTPARYLSFHCDAGICYATVYGNPQRREQDVLGSLSLKNLSQREQQRAKSQAQRLF